MELKIIIFVHKMLSEYHAEKMHGWYGIVSYHNEGSRELNACILILAHMVYL